MSTMVAVRLFKNDDLEENWKEVPISSFMPSFLSGDDNIQNINKRIQMRFLREGATHIKARWHYQGNDDLGYWVSSEF